MLILIVQKLNLNQSIMKPFLLVLLSLFCSLSTWAQSSLYNYVAITPTGSIPGGDNTLVGVEAGITSNSNSSENTLIGAMAGHENKGGIGNTMIGSGTGYYNAGSYNSFVGARAGGLNGPGIGNTFFGYYSGAYNTTGSYNVFLGYSTGSSNQSGSSNLFMGSYAGATNNGSYNLFIGNSAGQTSTSGNGNTFIGDGAGYANQTGSQNTYIGRYAGFSGNSSGTNNVFIGFLAGNNTNNAVPQINNSIAIGANSVVTQSNSVVLGGTDAYTVNVGIGNSAPKAKLEITSGANAVSGLRFTNLTSDNQASLLNQTRFLTIDNSGNVILASLNSSGSGRIAAEEALWQRNSEGYLQSVQNKAVVIGQGVSRTPAGYKLFVEGGILTEKVKVAVSNSSEWSDYVLVPGYRLAPLAEVEKQIQQTGHLPGVPSAQQMVEQGNDLHKTDAKLLEKIEELTLYSIQLEKADQAKQCQLVQQQRRLDQLERLVKQLLKKK